jgi:hypothetical protein
MERRLFDTSNSCNLPALAANRRFGKYKQEGQKRTTMPELLEDEAVKKIFEIFRETRDKASSIWDIYGTTLDILKDHGIAFHPPEVERFSLAMGELNDSPSFPSVAGVFLSSLITFGQEGDFIVHTSHLPPLGYFGFKLHSKTVTVNGHLGNHVGNEMGRDFIFFNSILIINGDVGHALGNNMNGGEIHVNGKIEGLGSPNKGRIYHNGKLIVDK